ncbi:MULTISPECIES: copper homeostasis protein CutC [Rhizobium]|uniref:copper homeostasis protein CutC n=1 Tax=Rhizobium TaxID=379 RepID=UPI0007EAB8CE|nr:MULTISPECIES: copper homeostasis protein CutC [Rhizobium]ANK90046.1 copper homeostasis protein CutC [Rhizobium sp. N6212]ANK96073.1 copper homeostasis protein CutC [Rhizobium sp. N621]ANL02101.1 copper homeostasis protein CutC [Rhizobium esperanzae]ANL08229.1 copper homeostasis protein CutC [Rhizobium sp. N1341]ANL20278.1 copper homeostasis protein CutC [Rhizobium sp. N113]
MTILLEVCVDSAEGLAAAIEGGAGRIELCSALELGGLTPLPSLMRIAARAPIPVYAMIRPHAGPFIFGSADEEAMLLDIDAVRAAGLAGVVIGANRPDGTLDMPLIHRLKAHTSGLGSTLHRAFDLVPDANQALEQAVELGVERILTSGCALKAADGIEKLKRLSAKAAGRISIMPGSGIRPANVTAILQATGAREVHGSCSSPVESVDPRAVAFGFEAKSSNRTDVDVVRDMRRAIAAAG